jgi:hypothetical protein
VVDSRKVRGEGKMAITIILPEYVEPNTERVLFAALKNFGAERISAKEWQFNLIPLSQQEFVAEFRQFLPTSHHWMLDRFKFKNLEKALTPLITPAMNRAPPTFGPRRNQY